MEPDSATRATLEAALKTFSTAFVAGTAEVLDTLLSPDYVHTNGGTASVLDKTRWLTYVRSRRTELESGKLRQDRYEMAGVTIRWFPNAAVVNSQVISEGIRDGARFASRLQVTQVWIRVGQRWLRVAFHDSPIPA